MTSALIDKDLKHIWHPCSQMKDYQTFKPVEVIKAEGTFIELKNGKKIIDGISSWWCKALGHQHPRLKTALLQQIDKFEHVMLAHTTNETIVKLSEKLAALTNNLDKVFYASEGSSAIEIALKMSLHARKLKGETKRNLFIALENAYHGETVGALSVSDLGLYRSAYADLLFPTDFISPLPYVHHRHDPLWHDCRHHWESIEKKLDALSEKTTAIIIEPIVQGAGGMQIYAQDFLKRLRHFTKERGIHLIADEIMTGIGRTGKMLACEHGNIEPDFLCLAKGLTSGWMPLSVVLTHADIYDLFYADYAQGKSFLHSHTYSGHALSASIAVEVLNLFAEEKILEKAERLESVMYQHFLEIAEDTKQLKNIRAIGGIVAGDLITSANRRAGYEVCRHAMEKGALLRPLGNTLYWLPPLNIAKDELDELKRITKEAIYAVKWN